MAKKFEQIIRTEKWEIEEGARNKVLDSSAELVIYMRKSMKRCAELTVNQALFEMYKLFKKYLRDYATVLTRKLPA